jgi:hypothetical protein
LLRLVRISSINPSIKYWLARVSLRFLNGRTAIDFSGLLIGILLLEEGFLIKKLKTIKTRTDRRSMPDVTIR